MHIRNLGMWVLTLFRTAFTATNDLKKNQNNYPQEETLDSLLNETNPVSVGVLNNSAVNYAQI